MPWLTVLPASADPLVPISAYIPGCGRDAIALARAQQPSRILLDERLARAAAIRLNLKVTESAAVLLAAKQVGIIALVKP
jgi:predicted nucleic acid-binding protein